ncbi:site-2 protease family protein [Streptomyces sp. NPDC096132]|uniref:site-2 protease family protein n=1 Tax=Streptomyces sp. NPDC096132 TaxID=3366075 RepID=UPI00382C291F
MVESGGSGRPRPDSEESAEHPAPPAPQATAPAEPPQRENQAAEGPTTPGDTPTTADPTPAPTAGQEPRPTPPTSDAPTADTDTSNGQAAEATPTDEPGNGQAPRPQSAGDARNGQAAEATPTGEPANGRPVEPPSAGETANGQAVEPPSPDGSANGRAVEPPPPGDARNGQAAASTPTGGSANGQAPESPSASEPRDTPAAPTAPADDDAPVRPPAPTAPEADAHADRARAHAGGHESGDTDSTGPIPVLTKGAPPQRPPEQPRGGLLMGRPFGVPVYVAPSWFLVAALITWVFGGQLDRVLPELGVARYLVSLFFAVAFYASVLIHELAHTIAALRFKLPVRRIQLQFFGGVSEIEKEAETPGREFWLAFVGPLLSLVLAGVFYAAMQPVEPGTVPGVLLAGLMISNLIVAIFNLLPGLPLDGGRMLRAVVWKITGKPMSGTIAAAWVGRALAVSVLIGLPLLTQSGALGSSAEDSVGMDTVTDALLAAILAAIIWTGAGNSLRMARLREHLPELRARTLTRRAVPVETDTPLSEALRRANAAGARALVVVDAHGEPLSLVREAAIVGVPEHRRPWVAVSGLAQDLTDGMRISAELAGEDLLDVLRATPATEYLVVEETGEIYGVLSAADVERAFVKAMARPN